MAENLSTLSLLAVALYLFVAAACFASGMASLSRRQTAWHSSVWITLAVFFALLCLMRGLGVEDQLRDGLRDVLRSEGTYDERRSLQSIVAAAIFLVFGAAAAWWSYRFARKLKGKRNLAILISLASAGAMVLLILLRLLSLHAIDWVLYGPLKANWLIDIGASLIVLAAAAYYIVRVRGRP